MEGIGDTNGLLLDLAIVGVIEGVTVKGIKVDGFIVDGVVDGT